HRFAKRSVLRRACPDDRDPRCDGGDACEELVRYQVVAVREDEDRFRLALEVAGRSTELSPCLPRAPTGGPEEHPPHPALPGNRQRGDARAALYLAVPREHAARAATDYVLGSSGRT